LVVALALIFIALYATVALEHPVKISKSASALFGVGLLWTVYALAIGRCELAGSSSYRDLRVQD